MTEVSFESLNKKTLLHDAALLAVVGDVYREDEATFVKHLLETTSLTAEQERQTEALAQTLVSVLRKERTKDGGLEAFLFQYDLTSEEGIALMCMAEALLRIPDKQTIDKLIRDKLTQGDWESHLGKSNSMFVNAATWCLMLTGKVMGDHVSVHSRFQKQAFTLKTGLLKLASKGGEPLVRQVVSNAIKILGKQFVMGRTITEAIKRAQKTEAQGYLYSYDMLGEAAFTQEDAEKYFLSYKTAIEAISKACTHKTPMENPGISVKLSALHPRFVVKKRERVLAELVGKVRTLALMAKASNMNFTIDAEEADTLVLLLEVYGELAKDPQLKGWQGLGLAVQAYQKRAQTVLDWLIALARRENQPMMIRLVKGAYWDSEIKWSQVNGLSGYPVFTRKQATDVNYIACVKKLLSAQDVIFPQFATHNAHTVATIMTLAKEIPNCRYEFQCLHGMGSPLYDQIVSKDKTTPCRVYAPVGTHEALLAYLVRRLLENGANTSFVNRIVDEDLSVSELVSSPIRSLKGFKPVAHPNIPLPANIFSDRLNSKGVDLNNPLALQKLMDDLEKSKTQNFSSAPTAMTSAAVLETKPVSAPFDNDYVLGKVTLANQETVESALSTATMAFKNMPGFEKRAEQLRAMADHLEANMQDFLTLLVLEAGKTYDDAVSEVREAVDFCRYYANEAIRQFKPQPLPGPTGEYNEMSLWGRGVIACISPWNFPLAIFLGQVTAAYAAGNSVIAKPSSQTPLIAQRAIDGLHQVGIDKHAIQNLPGSGRVVGDALVTDLRVQGVVFTGSTDTARSINQKLAQRTGAIVPLIAETGGQNAMIVDSTALPEQVVADVIASSFRSAGQRCSSLRVLYLQEDIADKILTMLIGAMKELKVGNPMAIDTDIGPVIDKNAQAGLLEHLTWLDQNAKKLYQMSLEGCDKGTFVPPSVYEIKAMSELKQENFGPILHVVRFERSKLDHVLNEINNSGFGLTLGIHSRIDQTIAYIFERAKVGNVYVNRNMVGAVVGVQPFGGEGLSGTGPKAGGPHYVTRLATERSLSINTTAAGGNASLMALSAVEA